MKRLIEADPQGFISLLSPEALYTGQRTSEFPIKSLYADALLEAVEDGKRMLCHYEFQLRGDTNMPLRLLEYNVEAMVHNGGLPVASCVIYLRKERPIAESPLLIWLPRRRQILRFDFEVVVLPDIPTEEFKRIAHKGLLPLLPLTREGAKREVIEEVITRLSSVEENEELLALAYGFASMVFTTDEESLWLKRRFTMLSDILKETWAFREIADEAREEGLQQGRQEGLQQGRQEGLQQLQQATEKEREATTQLLRDMLLDIVVRRFPKFSLAVWKSIDTLKDHETLRSLLVTVSTVQTTEEAQEAILAAGESLRH